jgi:hypothetical protein
MPLVALGEREAKQLFQNYLGQVSDKLLRQRGMAAGAAQEAKCLASDLGGLVTLASADLSCTLPNGLELPCGRSRYVSQARAFPRVAFHL